MELYENARFLDRDPAFILKSMQTYTQPFIFFLSNEWDQ